MAATFESTVPHAKPQAGNPSRTVPFAILRELAAVMTLVVLVDLTIYRGHGFAGLALLLVAAPALLLLGSARPVLRGSFWLLGAMLLVLAGRMLWLGSGLAMGVGAVLLIAFSLALVGRRPDATGVLLHALQLSAAGGFGLNYYRRSLVGRGLRLSRLLWLNLLLPVGAVVLFGTLFILANPDLARSVAEQIERCWIWLADWTSRLSENWLEILFWAASAYLAIGLLRPLLPRTSGAAVPIQGGDAELVELQETSPLFIPLRNMLLGVIGLFAIYLVFEFRTLWFRDFPKGFHYSGYAHEGAGWLTAALAAATLVLSLIFRGQVLRDPRLASLRLLGWIWSGLNLLLAVTVYHRMSIYIDFNGMTRMRTIGLFGITTVVAGFVLVLYKVHYNRDFVWLIQRQLWALAIAIYLYALTPVDMLVHSYNVRQILAGDVAPSVQISVHPNSPEGYLVLTPLARCQDPIIREGVRALLAEQQLSAERRAAERAKLGWTTYQLSDRLLLDELREESLAWKGYSADAKRRAAALERFHKYAYQWY